MSLGVAELGFTKYLLHSKHGWLQFRISIERSSFISQETDRPILPAYLQWMADE